MGPSSGQFGNHIAFNFSGYNQLFAFFDRRFPDQRPMFPAMKALIANFNA